MPEEYAPYRILKEPYWRTLMRWRRSQRRAMRRVKRAAYRENEVRP